MIFTAKVCKATHFTAVTGITEAFCTAFFGILAQNTPMHEQYPRLFITN